MHDIMNIRDERLSNKIIYEFLQIIMRKDFTSQDDSKRELSKEFSIAHISIVNTIQILARIKKLSSRQMELARISAALHDFHTVLTGETLDHARKSAKLAKEFLKRYELTGKEADLICLAIESHSDKLTRTKNWLVELLKDADCIDCELHSQKFYPPENPKTERMKEAMMEYGF